MKRIIFTRRNRIKVLKRIIRRLNLELDNNNLYGYKDGFEIYEELNYWEDKLEQLKLLEKLKL